MKTAALALLVLVAGCSGPLPLHVRGARELPPSVLEACDLIELACEYSPKRYGAIDIKIKRVDYEGEPVVMGEADDAICRPELWVDDRNPVRVAHEIGHVLGLEHDDDPDNVMAAVSPGGELDDEQLDTIARNADRLIGCGNRAL